jgi:hyperosmotically inducible periplasmic protein
MNSVSRARGLVIGVALGFLAATAAVAATSDPWITTKAKLSLLTSKDVHATSVNVDTVDGKVTLHGKVETTEEKTKAEDVVKQIDGVASVHNLLQVVPPSKEKQVAASDDQIKDHVKQALRRDKTLEDVSVQSVNNGVVLLSGDVKTLTDHLKAVQTASNVGGVRRVESEIKSPDQISDVDISSDKSASTGRHRGQ